MWTGRQIQILGVKLLFITATNACQLKWKIMCLVSLTGTLKHYGALV